MWRLCDNIRDVINTYDGTFYNLSVYVCNGSLGARKIIHPILSLKLGVIGFFAIILMEGQDWQSDIRN
jgi:hypothetical protein